MSAIDSDSDPMLMWIERARAAERERDEARHQWRRAWDDLHAAEAAAALAEGRVTVLAEAVAEAARDSDEPAVRKLLLTALRRAVPGESETP